MGWVRGKGVTASRGGSATQQLEMEMTEPYSTDPVTKIDEVFPQDTNAYNTLFGGRLMSIMDTAAGMVSSKFAHREFVTVSVDALKFKRPAYQGDLIETTARVVHTSTHTAGVHVVAKRLNRSEWVTEEICSGFFFMVAIDSQMRPIPIPQMTPQTEDERRMWDLAQAARAAMKAAER
ncbi:MAG: acyl-CoA thioesterase [Euryarchaeota archaeon]|nr:acyl-CoA thioesterase [Euryarchaeota archaeon]